MNRVKPTDDKPKATAGVQDESKFSPLLLFEIVLGTVLLLSCFLAGYCFPDPLKLCIIARSSVSEGRQITEEVLGIELRRVARGVRYVSSKKQILGMYAMRNFAQGEALNILDFTNAMHIADSTNRFTVAVQLKGEAFLGLRKGSRIALANENGVLPEERLILNGDAFVVLTVTPSTNEVGAATVTLALSPQHMSYVTNLISAPWHPIVVR